jgi:hypothetical protein
MFYAAVLPYSGVGETGFGSVLEAASFIYLIRELLGTLGCGGVVFEDF